MPNVVTCVSYCETANPRASADELLDALTRACWHAGFPQCERVYAGSSFCENYFLGLADGFHDAVRSLCRAYDMKATLVVPIIGQARFSQFEKRMPELLDRYADVYDEVVVNDVACFMDMIGLTDARLGLGRLFSKARRDARYREIFQETSSVELSPEALACVRACAASPLIELDPVSRVVDVAPIKQVAPEAEIALHLPYCYATTGRMCGSASIDDLDSRKFRVGRECGFQCLRMRQGSCVEENVRFAKHGRTYYYENPACQIAGTDSWRIVYAAGEL